MRFRKNPVEFDAVQFTGDNFDEVQAFVGKGYSPSTCEEMDLFNPLGTFLPAHLYDQVVDDNPIPTAELWVDANHQWLPIVVGEWVIKDQLGFYPCKNEIMQKNNTPLDENGSELECTCEPPTFGQEIVGLLNKHSMEKYSGTPDWILGNFLEMVLRQFDCAVMMRANWRGESVELPAFQELRVKADGKIVPLVMYEDGRRNEIGEAKIDITPGEVRVTGTIKGVVPIFEQLMPEGQYSIADVQHGG